MAPFTSMTELLRLNVEPYQRLVWFLCEAVEREHRLNLKALSDTPSAFLQAWARMPGSVAPALLNPGFPWALPAGRALPAPSGRRTW